MQENIPYMGAFGIRFELKHGPKILWCCTGTVSSLSQLKS